VPGIYNETGQHGNYDQTRPRWKGAVAVAPGDLICRPTSGTYSGYDVPLSLYTWNTNETTTLQEIHDIFRGVSMARRVMAQTADGDHQDGMIMESGEFRFPCAALGSAAEVGALVTGAKASGNSIENQTVKITSTLGEALGVLTRAAAVGDVWLFFKIMPVLAVGRGVQAIQ
jgi:hypothetical protein